MQHCLVNLKKVEETQQVIETTEGRLTHAEHEVLRKQVDEAWKEKGLEEMHQVIKEARRRLILAEEEKASIKEADEETAQEEVSVKLGSKKHDKRTTPGIPTWSPTVVLTWPDSA